MKIYKNDKIVVKVTERNLSLSVVAVYDHSDKLLGSNTIPTGEYQEVYQKVEGFKKWTVGEISDIDNVVTIVLDCRDTNAVVTISTGNVEIDWKEV